MNKEFLIFTLGILLGFGINFKYWEPKIKYDTVTVTKVIMQPESKIESKVPHIKPESSRFYH